MTILPFYFIEFTNKSEHLTFKKKFVILAKIGLGYSLVVYLNLYLYS